MGSSIGIRVDDTNWWLLNFIVYLIFWSRVLPISWPIQAKPWNENWAKFRNNDYCVAPLRQWKRIKNHRSSCLSKQLGSTVSHRQPKIHKDPQVRDVAHEPRCSQPTTVAPSITFHRPNQPWPTATCILDESLATHRLTPVLSLLQSRSPSLPIEIVNVHRHYIPSSPHTSSVQVTRKKKEKREDVSSPFVSLYYSSRT